MRFTVCVLFVFCFVATAFGQVTHLNQGWDEDQRETFYFTPQGSQLIPYEWFLALEQADSEESFRTDDNMRRYGILPATPSERNPDGLPIGFVRDGVEPAELRSRSVPSPQAEQVKAATRFEIKRAYLGPNSEQKLYPREQQSWFGLTCAACHTHDIEFNGATIRIDGGSTQADLESFLRDLGKALEAAHRDSAKLQRFAANVGRGAGELNTFRAEVEQISDAVNRLVERNKATHPYGYGRLDAFGAILNAVCETALNDPDNRRESNAPVSYPSLWNTPFMGYVQWGATADLAEARNVGEVLGVFGCFTLTPGAKQFDSTVRLRNLVMLEHDLLKKLTTPAWPEEMLGKLDDGKIVLGRRLFAQNCQSCHPVRGDDGRFVLNDADRIPILSNTIDELGTDPLFLTNLLPTDTVSTGVLKPLLNDQDRAPRLAVLGVVVRNIMQQLAQTEQVDLVALMPKPQAPPNTKGMGYIARPLEGIWANAPYFHNGSVPNLYETLLPAAERSTHFWTGTRKFDPVKVGFVTEQSDVSSEFHVVDESGNVIPGNSNAGHEGHGNSAFEGFTQTFENGVWRDFTDNERYALVEYMKSLGPPATQPSQPVLEQIPDGEAERIANIVDLTVKQMRQRYGDGKRMLRGVHPKDHGCVTATFEVLPTLPPEYAVGIFQPGKTYDAFVRFSNAAVRVGPDSRTDDAGNPVHGSRGMAVKLLGVEGESLLPPHGALTQDFLMVNQPAFAFANVEDYEVLSQVLLDNDDQPTEFFRQQLTTGSREAKARALRTKAIAERIAAHAVNGTTGAFSQPPASPVDNPYFSAAPFLFGEGRVMKFRASPVDRSLDAPNVADPNYLRTALIQRLKTDTVVFDFAVQVRSPEQLDVPNDIENASTEWNDEWVTVARITIPLQDFNSPEQRVKCERLFFTPWHGITDHQPLGGINRLRRAVYLASGKLRSLPKEPAAVP